MIDLQTVFGSRIPDNPSSGQFAAWNKMWMIEVDPAYVSSALTAFPVLLRRAHFPSNIFTLDATGGSLRAASDFQGVNRLPIEIEAWSSGSNLIIAWIPRDLISTGYTKIYLWAGKTGETQPARGAAYGSEAVWDSDFQTVQHMTLSSGTIYDSTVNARNGANTNGTQIDGLIYKALEWNFNGYVTMPNATLQNISGLITISLWIYGDAAGQPANQSVFGAVNASNTRIINSHTPFGNSNIYWDAGLGPIIDRINKLESTPSKYEGQWNHYAYTKDVSLGSMKIYQNGALWHSGTGKTQTIPGNTTALFNLAVYPNDVTSQYDGALEEFRISKTERSADWIKAEYYSTNGTTNFALLRTYPE